MRETSNRSDSGTECGDGTTTDWNSKRLLYNHTSKLSTAKPVLEKLLDSNFNLYLERFIKTKNLLVKFEGQVRNLKRPFARLFLGPGTEHLKEYFILCKKNDQTINNVYLAEKASHSYDEFSVGRLLGSMVLHPICWAMGLGWEKVSGIVERRSDFTLSYFEATKLGNKYEINPIQELPGDYNDYYC